MSDRTIPAAGLRFEAQPGAPKPFHRNDLLDQRELSRALGVSFADIDRALVARRIPLPSTGAVPGLYLWHRDEIAPLIRARG